MNTEPEPKDTATEAEPVTVGAWLLTGGTPPPGYEPKPTPKRQPRRKDTSDD